MTLTAEQAAEVTREAHVLGEDVADLVSKIRIELHGTVPEAVFEDHVRLAVRERHAEEWDRLMELRTTLDCMRAELDVRMVKAHEWLMDLRERAEN